MTKEKKNSKDASPKVAKQAAKAERRVVKAEGKLQKAEAKVAERKAQLKKAKTLRQDAVAEVPKTDAAKTSTP